MNKKECTKCGIVLAENEIAAVIKIGDTKHCIHSHIDLNEEKCVEELVTQCIDKINEDT